MYAPVGEPRGVASPPCPDAFGLVTPLTAPWKSAVNILHNPFGFVVIFVVAVVCKPNHTKAQVLDEPLEIAKSEYARLAQLPVPSFRRKCKGERNRDAREVDLWDKLSRTFGFRYPKDQIRRIGDIETDVDVSTEINVKDSHDTATGEGSNANQNTKVGSVYAGGGHGEAAESKGAGGEGGNAKGGNAGPATSKGDGGEGGTGGVGGAANATGTGTGYGEGGRGGAGGQVSYFFNLSEVIKIFTVSQLGTKPLDAKESASIIVHLFIWRA